jgi:RES domain-containing protein
MTGTTIAPLPPADLGQRNLALEIFSTGTELHRFHAARFGPTFFDKSRDGRFNAPDASYGTLYVACHRRGAFAESLLRDVGTTSLSENMVMTKAYVSFQLLRQLRAVRVTGNGLHAIGATAAVNSVGSYDIPQAWSKALHDHPSQPDAILYRSRHDDDQLCLAVFERASGAVAVTGSERHLLRTGWFLELLEDYGVGLSPT